MFSLRKRIILSLIICIIQFPLTFASIFTVANTNDFGGGSLRQALTDAGLDGSATILAPHQIVFTIPAGSIIQVDANLTIANQPIEIDGTSAPGWSSSNLIILNPTATSTATWGMRVTTPGCGIFGLQIEGFNLALFLPPGSDNGKLGEINRGNVISGNVNCIDLRSNDWTIQANKIGTDPTGTIANPNTGNNVIDIWIGTTGNLIGGNTFGEGNIISGNTGIGGVISSDGVITVLGNFIGTDITGNNPIRNSGIGIDLSNGNGSIIGDGTVDGGNVISGNNRDGIDIDVDNVLVLGNKIGVTYNLNDTIGNYHGINILNGINTTIGDGTSTGANYIGGNNQYGISINSDGNNVNGNFIGTDLTASLDLGNLNHGVAIFGNNNNIGGTIANQGNTIGFNKINGIRVSGQNNPIRRNTIICNNPVGITLVAGNSNKIAPVISNVIYGAGTASVSGTYFSNGDEIEVYIADDGCSNNQGANYLGTATVVSGTWSLSGLTIPEFSSISATATDGTNNTSEFANYTPSPFITTWKTDNPGTSGTNQITIPTIAASGPYNYNIYWEEVGTPGNNGIATGLTADHTITFPSAGNYRVEISGIFPHISINNLGDREKILTIEQWGDISWKSMENAFYGATNLVVNATDVPYLTQVTKMNYMLAYISSFNQDVSGWDVSGVVDMNSLFFKIADFNQDVSNWDVANVSDMDNMFYECKIFNNGEQPLAWGSKTSNVSTMFQLFANDSLFNQDISNWDVSNVISMQSMFLNATNFNNNGIPLNWGTRTARVKNMHQMFSRASSFNQDVSGWSVDSVTNMASMFLNAISFNNNSLPLSWGAKTSRVKSMFQMFSGAFVFDQDISGWSVDSVTNMRNMFLTALSFNNGGVPLSWGNKVRMVTDMSNMFNSATSFNQNLGGWNIAFVNDFSGMLDGSNLSVDNYDSTLIGWEALGGLNSGMTLGADNLNYCNAATEHANLISTYLWTIDDLGPLCPCNSLIVTSTVDDGSCGSLSGAITFANSNVGKDTISFNFPGASPWIITISTDLPQITEEVVIDGSTQPGWASNDMPTIQNPGFSVKGFDINADSVEIYGLRITGFNSPIAYSIHGAAGRSGIVIGAPFKGNILNGNYHGLWIRGPGAIIQGNKIGTDSSGTFAIPNDYGIRVDDCVNCIIGGSGTGEGNLVSGNNVMGIRLLSSDYATIQGNYVGTDISGTYAIPNGSSGIELGWGTNVCDSNLVGGTNPGEANLVSGNGNFGIRILSGSANEVYGNLVGTNFNGLSALPNVSSGISLGFTSSHVANNNRIGGSNLNQKNTIIPGTIAGIRILTGNGNRIYGNTVGLNIVGDTINVVNTSPMLISSSEGVNQNIIGGLGVGEPNVFVGGSAYGIRIDGDAANPAMQNTVRGNILYYNNQGGLELQNTANNSILAPSITNFTTGLGTASIQGNCPTCAAGDLIDVYRDSTNSIVTQANEILGTVIYTSDPWALGGLTINSGERFTANVTDVSGNTSEFFVPESEIEVFFGSDTNGVNIMDSQPSIIDIGKVHTGDSIDATFTIFNNGLEYLIIDTIQLLSGSPEFYIAHFGSDTLLPFEIDTFVLRFYSPSAGNHTGVLRINNNDNDESNFSFSFMAETIEPEIDVYLGNNTSGFLLADGFSTASFGSDIQGNDIARTFTIQNTGTEDLYISSIVVTGTDYSINSSIDTIPIGSTDTFTVTLSGLTVGSFTETLTINSNDPDEAAFDFFVDGTITPGPEPEIDVYQGLDNSGISITNNQTTAIDFGNSPEGTDITLSFAIENTGTADLTVSGISVAGLDFSITSSIGIITMGNTANFSVTLSGLVAGNFNDTIVIINDDSDDNPFEFPITGVITPCDPRIVNNLLDDGSCGSLRGAIIYSNATFGIDTIVFTSTASSGSIDLLSDLPVITETVIIDGHSSPLWSDTPVIDITSSAVNYGLDIQAARTQINGLAFSNMPPSTTVIQVSNSDSVIIENCHLGVDTSGTITGNPTIRAIQINGGSTHEIKSNLFARSSDVAISLVTTRNAQIEYNIFGTSIDYSMFGGNWQPRVAIALNSNCDNTLINNNLIASTFNESVAHYDSKHTTFTNNMFGADTSGTYVSGWTSDSWISMFNSDSNSIGLPGQGNTFLNSNFNNYFLSNSNYNTIQSNTFGFESDGNTTSLNHLGNHAIWLSNSHSNQIGGFGLNESNIISARNDGLRIDSDSLNKIWGNIIYNNGGVGINIFTGAQENVIPPSINASGDTVYTGNSSPNALIQLYADAGSQGQLFIDTVRANAFGVWANTFTESQINNYIGLGLDSLTAIQDSSGNTSAFSTPVAFFLKTPLIWNNTDFTVLNGNIVNINLLNSIDDPDEIIDTNKMSILTGLLGGSSSSVDTTSGILTIDLTNSPTLLLDSIQVEICDIYNECSARYLVFNIVNSSIPDPIVHNAISVSDLDGINDVLVIDNIEHYPKSRLIILNKWGTNITDIIDYNNNTNFWDAHFNDAPIVAGTYFYMLWLNSNGKGKPFQTGIIEVR